MITQGIVSGIFSPNLVKLITEVCRHLPKFVLASTNCFALGNRSKQVAVSRRKRVSLRPEIACHDTSHGAHPAADQKELLRRREDASADRDLSTLFPWCHSDLSRALRTHGGAQSALVFGTPILTIEVDENRGVGNSQLCFKDEDMVLCGVLCDFVDE